MTDDKHTALAGQNPFTHMANAWLEASESMFTSFLKANQAALSVYTGENDPASNGPDAFDRVEAPIPSLYYREPDWSFERTVDSVDHIGVGDTVRFTKPIDDQDVRTFARVSGDTNRLHLDDAFAEDTRFEGRIVHGTLVAGLISAALARLPGLTIYLSQDLRFVNPVDIDDTLTAIVEVVEDIGGGQYRLSTVVENDDGDAIIEGEAVVLVDDLPGEPYAAE